MKQYKLFLVGVNSGKLELVEVLGENPYIEGGIYIRYSGNRGTDTTKERFLFDIPAELQVEVEKIDDFKFLPLKPTQAMLYAAEHTDLTEFCSSSRQSRHHDIAGQVYKAMTEAYTS